MPPLTLALLQSAMLKPPLVLEQVPCPELGEDVFAYVKQLTCDQAEIIENINGETLETQRAALMVMGRILRTGDTPMPTMTPREAEAILADPPTLRAPLVAATLCDAEGNLLIQTEEQRAALSQLPPSLMRRLHTAAWKLNGTGDDKVEEAVKNFVRHQTDDSGTVWHVNGAVPSASVSNS